MTPPKVNRRTFLGCSAALPLAAPNRPNIVLIVTDNQGRDAGCYGNTVIKTPNLDGLAADGVRMTHAFCTTSSCSPSRSVILTGQYAHANGMYGLEHAYHHFSTFDDVQSLPVILGKSGYRTCRAGKLHVGPEKVYRFDTTLEVNSRNPVEMAEKAKPFITAGGNRPFFLYFCPYDPHRDHPFFTWPEPNRFANRPEGYPGVTPVTYDPKKIAVPSFLPDTPECRAELSEYYQSISRVDQGIGHLFEILRQTGQYDNTVFVYLSDNGSAFPGALTTLYEPGMRLPCVVRTPYQQRRGIACNAMVSWTDIAPTLADFAGVDLKETQFQGRSFRNALEKDSPPGWDEVYASHSFHEVTMYHPMRVVRGRRYKLIWNIAYEQTQPISRDIGESSTWQSIVRRGIKTLGKRPIEAFLHRPQFELYDLKSDPDEIRNLAGDAGHTAILEEMKKKLRLFQERTKDPWIISWDDHRGLHVVERH